MMSDMTGQHSETRSALSYLDSPGHQGHASKQTPNSDFAAGLAISLHYGLAQTATASSQLFSVLKSDSCCYDLTECQHEHAETTAVVSGSERHHAKGSCSIMTKRGLCRHGFIYSARQCLPLGHAGLGCLRCMGHRRFLSSLSLRQHGVIFLGPFHPRADKKS